MFQSIKAAYAAILETLSDLSTATAALKAAVVANTAATAGLDVRLTALDERLQSIEAAAKATQQATAYLSAAEKHRREQGGIRHEF